MDLQPLPSDLHDDTNYTSRSNSSSEPGQYRPPPRYSHCTAIFNDNLYLWGGMQADLPSDHASEEKLEVLSIVDTLSLKTGDWEQHKTSGIPPLGAYASSCTSLRERLFYFGGHCGHENCYHDSLHSLDPSLFEWSQFIPTNPDSGPMSKAWCGMVGFEEGETAFLCMFGGLGLLPESFSELQCTPDEVDPTFGWTNEIHLFSLNKGSWLLPTVIGEAPPPCDAFTLTSIGENKAAMYGGGTAKCLERLSELYLLEMESKQMTWSRLQSSGPQPSGRRLHAAAYISGSLLGQTEPLLFTGGGMGGKRKALSDYWLLNFKTGNWEQVILQGSVANFLKRMGHTLSAMTLGSGCTWIVLVGGVSQWDRAKPEHAQPFCSSRTFKIVLELVHDRDGQWSITRIPTSKHHGKLMERLEQEVAAQPMPNNPAAADMAEASPADKPAPNLDSNDYWELDGYIHQFDGKVEQFERAVLQLDEEFLQLEATQPNDEADNLQLVNKEGNQCDDEAYHLDEQEVRQSKEGMLADEYIQQSLEDFLQSDETDQQWEPEIESRAQLSQQSQEAQESNEEVQQLDGKEEMQPMDEIIQQLLNINQQPHTRVQHYNEEVLQLHEEEVQLVEKGFCQSESNVQQLNEEAKCLVEEVQQRKNGEEESMSKKMSIEQVNHVEEKQENPRNAEQEWKFEQLRQEVEQLNKYVTSLQQALLASETRVEITERRASDADRQALESAYQAEEFKQRLLAVEQQVESALLRAQEAEQRALMAEHQIQFHPVTWIVQREQIEMTEREIGRGHWTEVKIAKFRQTVVAAKCLHEVVLSKDNIQQFSREMYTAALLRHPNIVRFIGAVSAGEAVVLLELMPTSLRNELQKLELSVSVVRTIGRDVAQALNYLHQWQPCPILHKDVSSSNVLLEPLGCSNWRAKLADHGTANFLRRMMPPHEWGVYSPPEADQPQDHSTKMDVYSFGVLLAEMCVNQFPPATHEDKVKLINTIQWPNLRVVAQRCTNIDPSERPSIALAISNL